MEPDWPASADRQLLSGLLQHLRETGAPAEIADLVKVFEKPALEIEDHLKLLFKANLVRYERSGANWGWVAVEQEQE